MNSWRLFGANDEIVRSGWELIAARETTSTQQDTGIFRTLLFTLGLMAFYKQLNTRCRRVTALTMTFSLTPTLIQQ